MYRKQATMGQAFDLLQWIKSTIPIEYILLAILLSIPVDYDSPEPSSASGGGTAGAQTLQCDARASVLTWAPALCPAAAAVHTTRNLAEELTWEEASELLQFLPFVLFRFPDHKGAGLLAILASHFTDGPKAPTPKDSLQIPNNNTPSTASTTSANPSNLAVKNRFARSFSQLVASQLVPGDLITMAKSQGILTNMGVDYVVVFRFATTGESVF